MLYFNYYYCYNELRIIVEVKIMDKYVCDICGYEYDPAVGVPEQGIAPGTPFEELPEDFACPLCGVGKDNFSKA